MRLQRHNRSISRNMHKYLSYIFNLLEFKSYMTRSSFFIFLTKDGFFFLTTKDVNLIIKNHTKIYIKNRVEQIVNYNRQFS